REIVDQDTPKALVGDLIVNDSVVLATSQFDASPHRGRTSDAELRHVGIVVVMDIVVPDYRAGRGSCWTGLAAGTSTVLWRGPVIVIEAIGDNASFVL